MDSCSLRFCLTSFIRFPKYLFSLKIYIFSGYLLTYIQARSSTFGACFTCALAQTENISSFNKALMIIQCLTWLVLGTFFFLLFTHLVRFFWLVDIIVKKINEIEMNKMLLCRFSLYHVFVDRSYSCKWLLVNRMS